ncbi:hypothetical protein OHA01_26425 [Micromonospora zamorensis]|uniref:hypothetical protein n=1 Tax=Micromonospora zamorensis TaxID=709883 RepID=UPI00386A4B86|nr:hypothetical protein OHA01_26425 [Micromonospora zamorensis]
MVRGEWVDRPKGPPVWQEWKPDACPAGHTRLGAATWACPDCNWPVRVWPCATEDCREVIYDPDHVHGE